MLIELALTRHRSLYEYIDCMMMVGAAVVWGVLGGGTVFWGVFTVLHVFTVLLLSLRVYYVGQLRFGELATLAYLHTTDLLQIHVYII